MLLKELWRQQGQEKFRVSPGKAQKGETPAYWLWGLEGRQEHQWKGQEFGEVTLRLQMPMDISPQPPDSSVLTWI